MGKWAKTETGDEREKNGLYDAESKCVKTETQKALRNDNVLLLLPLQIYSIASSDFHSFFLTFFPLCLGTFSPVPSDSRYFFFRFPGKWETEREEEKTRAERNGEKTRAEIREGGREV